MSIANSYHVLLTELEQVSHRINYHQSLGVAPEKQDLEYQEKVNCQLEVLRKMPASNGEIAEKLQSNLHRVLEFLLNEFSHINERRKFPLLNQNTTKKDGLFGNILTELKNSFLNPGYSQPSSISYSEQPWGVEALGSVLKAYFKDIKTKHFKSELEVVDYYIAIRDAINQIREQLIIEKVI